MINEPLIFVATSDLAGKVRGKSFPLHQFESRLQRGIGWTPTNVQITCFDSIADSPYGALGDLVLIPDPATRVEVDYEDNQPAERFVFGNIFHTDAEPFECCTRSILQAALKRLAAVGGVQLIGAFEHEFHFLNRSSPLGSAYSAAAFRSERNFAEALFAAMKQANLKRDTFMKEYGTNQYEVTIGPVSGVAIADYAATIRELVHITAERLGQTVSFSPLRDPASVGNGVHLHLSMCDVHNHPVSYDAHSEHGLSLVAGRFIAGILKYLDRIIALTAPSFISYTRLTPHRWSAAYNNLGFRDREAAVRICPVNELSDLNHAEQFNFEFRASDATASPYLALAAVAHAGAQGIEENLDIPPITEEDLSLLSSSELAKRNIVRLPQSLDSALEKFARDEIVKNWFPAGFSEVYLKHKYGEIAYLNGLTEAEICKAYESAY